MIDEQEVINLTRYYLGVAEYRAKHYATGYDAWAAYMQAEAIASLLPIDYEGRAGLDARIHEVHNLLREMSDKLEKVDKSFVDFRPKKSLGKGNRAEMRKTLKELGGI